MNACRDLIQIFRKVKKDRSLPESVEVAELVKNEFFNVTRNSH